MDKYLDSAKKLVVLGLGTLLFAACSDDAEGDFQEQELTQTEVRTILETEDAFSVADTAVSDLMANADSSAKTAKNEECYAATYTDTGFTATFNNCVLNGTENVNGSLTVVYATDTETVSFTATYTDFYVGTIKLNGTRTYVVGGNTEENALSFSITSQMELSMEDGSVISENGTKTVAFAFGATLEESGIQISGDWTLVVDGDTYKVEVGTPMEINFGCGYFTKGDMDVEKNGLVVNVDFGDGSCDDNAILTYPNGATQEISLKD